MMRIVPAACRVVVRAGFLVSLAFMFTPGVLRAADPWVAATDPAVVTNNDCGRIDSLSGRPLLRRSFQEEGAPGAPASIADRISSGDELDAPPDTRVEWITGGNTIAVLGSGGRVRFDGLRSFRDETGAEATRLDVTLLAGELRVQVRRNEARPERVLVALGGAEFLVTRGDAEFFADGGWRGAVLSGEAAGRLRRGTLPGAPFRMAEGVVVGASGESRMGEGEAEAIRRRLPFSFESARAALPPEPAMSEEMEAP